MAISLQADSTLPQGYILVDGQRVASVSTTGGLSATLAANTVTTSSLVSGSVTTEKIAPGAVITAAIASGAVTAAKMAGGQTGDAPVYGCRAWVNFDGSRDSTGALSTSNTNRFLRASGNVTSVLRNAAGSYTITFATAMPDVNYAAVITSGGTAGSVSAVTIDEQFARTTGTITVANMTTSFGGFDCAQMSVAIFR